MKRLKLSLLALIFYVSLTGQNPAFLNYQLLVTDSTGAIMRSKEPAFRFSILIDSTSGSVIYTEEHLVRTDVEGMASFTIGYGSEQPGIFESIDWRAADYFMKIEIAAAPGTNYKLLAIFQLLKVPYVTERELKDKSGSQIIEDEIFIIRKYIGKYVDFRHTGPVTYGGPNIIWIKSTMDKVYGKISAYGKRCDFATGDNLYIKRTYMAPGGVTGFWMYQVENDKGIYYTATDFQYDRKVLLETWF